MSDHDEGATVRPQSAGLNAPPWMGYVLIGLLGIGGGTGAGALTGGSAVAALQVQVATQEKEIERLRTKVGGLATTADINDLREEIRQLRDDVRAGFGQ